MLNSPIKNFSDSMKHYSTYQSQFIEMFGTLGNPKGKIESLGTLCNIQRGGSPRPISEYITDQSDGLNWIKIGDTDDSMYITKTEEKIKPSGLRKTRQVYAGDLLLSNSMSFGRPYILKIDGCIHDGWLVLHINDATKLSPIYLCSYLSQQGTYSEMAKLAAGGVVQNLNSNIIKQLAVIVPNMEEQTKYIQILEQADKSKFTSLKSQFIEMFGCKTPNVKVGDVSSVVSGKSISKDLEDIPGDIAYVKVADFNLPENNKYIQVSSRYVTSENANSSKLISPGTIIFAKNGAASMSNKKRLTAIECCIDMNTLAIIPNSQKVDSEFLYAIFDSLDLSFYVRQGAVPSISPHTIEGIEIYLPSFDEQLSFSKICKQTDKSKYIN